MAGAVTLLGVGVAEVASSSYAWADDDNDGDKLPLFLQKSLGTPAEATPGFVWQGSGNPNTGFLRKRNFDSGIELGIKAIFRQGPDIPPTYVDGQGRVHVEVPTGPQPGHPNRAIWSFNYSFGAYLPGASLTLDNYDATLWIDLDPSADTKFLKLKLTKLGPPGMAPSHINGWGWKSGNTVVIPDDEGTQRVTQNSQNYAFYASLIDADPNTPGIQPYTFGPGEFDVVMRMKKKGGDDNGNGNGHDDDDGWTTIHVVFDVVASPTP